MGMSTGKLAESSVVPTTTQSDLRVDCYVRSTVAESTAEIITAVVERLQQLCDRGQISNCRIRPWPPEHHAFSKSADTHEPTRHRLVTEFERWADQHDVTLDPAFRRQEAPPSPLGIGANESRERVRVPIVALALYEDEPTDADVETASLRGVVPCTDQLHTDTARTYTVDDWLSAIETEGGGKNSHDGQTDHPSQLEAEQ